ncbi:7839_t:CDS:1, partial [Dentiscutata heterogama]
WGEEEEEFGLELLGVLELLGRGVIREGLVILASELILARSVGLIEEVEVEGLRRK